MSSKKELGPELSLVRQEAILRLCRDVAKEEVEIGMLKGDGHVEAALMSVNKIPGCLRQEPYQLAMNALAWVLHRGNICEII
jgi:uncharacterized OB-fold protein